MAKILKVQKSRKEQVCGRCHKTIPVGSSYLYSELGFGPKIVRCRDCGLEPWECTSSDYQLSVGEIVYRWRDNYGINREAPEEIADELQNICDELQEKLDNLPESFQDSGPGEILQERIGQLEDAMMSLQDIDMETLETDAVIEICSEEPWYREDDERCEYLAIMDDDKIDRETKLAIVNKFQELIEEHIDEALGDIEI